MSRSAVLAREHSTELRGEGRGSERRALLSRSDANRFGFRETRAWDRKPPRKIRAIRRARYLDPDPPARPARARASERAARALGWCIGISVLIRRPGGLYLKPTIIKGGNKSNSGKQVLSQEVANSLEDMLVDAVYNGTGENAQVKHFQIAGKTSTAQKPSTKGGYEGYIPAFVGYPTNIDNRFVIYVYLDSPKGATYYGNTVAAPLFKKIAQYILFKDKKHYRFAMSKEKK